MKRYIFLTIFCFSIFFCFAKPKDSLFISYQIKKTLEDTSLKRYLLSDKKEDFLASFIKGMQKVDMNENCFFDSEDEYLDKLDLLHFQKEAIANYQKAELWLKNLKDITWAVPNKVGYKILKPSSEKQMRTYQSFAKVNYSINKATEFIALISKRNVSLDLTQVISGMALAMEGMKQKEIRQIFIHPDYGYGCDSHFEPNVGLNIKVELLDFQLKDFNESLLRPKENNFISPSDEECYQCAYKVAHYYGKKIWSRLKNKNKVFSLSEVIEDLKSDKFDEVNQLSEEEIEKNIYRIQWNIYEQFFLNE